MIKKCVGRSWSVGRRLDTPGLICLKARLSGEKEEQFFKPSEITKLFLLKVGFTVCIDSFRGNKIFTENLRSMRSMSQILYMPPGKGMDRDKSKEINKQARTHTTKRHFLLNLVQTYSHSISWGRQDDVKANF